MRIIQFSQFESYCRVVVAFHQKNLKNRYFKVFVSNDMKNLTDHDIPVP